MVPGTILLLHVSSAISVFHTGAELNLNALSHHYSNTQMKIIVVKEFIVKIIFSHYIRIYYLIHARITSQGWE